jgi:hypothetical protein
LIVFQGTYSAGDAVTIENGYEAVIRCNGGGAAAVVSFINYNIKTGSIYADGDLTITGSSRRILGSFNATSTSTYFQNSVVNANTNLGVIPNGTGAASQLYLFSSSDPTNSGFVRMYHTTGSGWIGTGKNGTGTAGYIAIDPDGGPSATRAYFTSTGVGIGTATPSYLLDVNGNTLLDGDTRLNGGVGIGTAPSASYKLDVNGDTRLNGEVGIGSAPSASYKLYVDSGAIGGIYSTTTGLIPAYFRSTDSTTGGMSITYFKDSSSPADGDDLTNLRFYGNDSGSNLTEYVRISAGIEDSADTSEDGTLSLFTAKAGSLQERVRYSSLDGFYIVDGGFRAPDVYAVNVGGTFRSAYISSAGVFGGLTSSIRYKENIEESAYGLDELMQLRSVTFNYKSDPTSARSLGFIAEEVDAIGLRELVSYNEENKPETVHYELVVSLLTKAIQEQQAMIQEQQAMIEDLKARISVLEAK